MLEFRIRIRLKNSIIHTFILENVIPDSVEGRQFDKKKVDYVDYSLKSLGSDELSSKSSSTLINQFEYNALKKKYGSLQKFVHGTEVAVNFCCNLFPIDEVHKIAVLDIRILNCDRNDENILVVKKKNSKGEREYKLIPIDHALSFPDCIEINEYEICWMGWEHSQKPFSKKMKDYIANIDILDDMKKISDVVKIRPKCLQNYRAANILLKIAACEYNLTPYEIGMILYRPGFDEVASPIEEICSKAMKISELYLSVHDKVINLEISQFNVLNNNYYDFTKYSLMKERDTGDEDTSNGSKINKLSVNEHEKYSLSTNSKSNLSHKISHIKKINNTNIISTAVPSYNKKKSIGINKILERTASEPKAIINDIWKDKNDEYDNIKPEVSSTLSLNNSKCMDSPFNEIYFAKLEYLIREYLELNKK